MAYGICKNAGCSRSYLNPVLETLRRRVVAAQLIAQSAGNFTPGMGDREYFEEFFQRGSVCTACGEALYKIAQPTVGVDAKENQDRVKLNELLDVAQQLQTWGVLPQL